MVRVILLFGAWLLLWLPIAIPLAIALKWHPPQPLTPAQKLPLLASLYLLAPLVVWGAATIWGGSLPAYGLPLQPQVLRSLAVGLGLGVLSIGTMYAIQVALGWMRWQVSNGSGWAIALLSTLPLGIWVGLTEEVIFRGVLLHELTQDYELIGAAAIASLIFALLHLIWEGKRQIPQLPGLWLMGMVLTLARWVDHSNLGLAWGLHAGWIWAIACLDTTRSLTYTQRSSQWITGLNDQPLAGLVGILFLLATGAILKTIGV